MLLLQEFEFDIQCRLGTQHAIANYLRQIETGQETKGIYEHFLDADVLQISAYEAETNKISLNNKWLEEMIHFLTTRLPP